MTWITNASKASRNSFSRPKELNPFKPFKNKAQIKKQSRLDSELSVIVIESKLLLSCFVALFMKSVIETPIRLTIDIWSLFDKDTICWMT